MHCGGGSRLSRGPSLCHPLVQNPGGFCVSFAVLADARPTCAHVRLLGPCYKTGRLIPRRLHHKKE